MMSSKANLSENIHFFRTHKGYSREELAHKVGITSSYMYILEKQPEREPSVFLVLNLAEALEVSIEELLFGPKKIKKPAKTNGVKKSKTN